MFVVCYTENTYEKNTKTYVRHQCYWGCRLYVRISFLDVTLGGFFRFTRKQLVHDDAASNGYTIPLLAGSCFNRSNAYQLWHNGSCDHRDTLRIHYTALLYRS